MASIRYRIKRIVSHGSTLIHRAIQFPSLLAYFRIPIGYRAYPIIGAKKLLLREGIVYLHPSEVPVKMSFYMRCFPIPYSVNRKALHKDLLLGNIIFRFLAVFSLKLSYSLTVDHFATERKTFIQLRTAT
jgi:hypothetical protein